MVDVDTGRFTVGVFQDAAWAQKGIDALKAAGIPVEWMSVIAKDAPAVAALFQQTFGQAGEQVDLGAIGPCTARGSLVDVLQGGDRALASLGLAGTMRRVGFQAHDGRIYEALTGRGGVLVAVKNEPRAADTLAIMLSYGGGNAAIGAWTGRV